MKEIKEKLLYEIKKMYAYGIFLNYMLYLKYKF